MEHINREAGMCSGDKDPKTGQKSNYGMEKHGLEQIHHTKLSESMFSRTYWKVTIYNIPHIGPYCMAHTIHHILIHQLLKLYLTVVIYQGIRIRCL